jgi:hypothetical protein
MSALFVVVWMAVLPSQVLAQSRTEAGSPATPTRRVAVASAVTLGAAALTVGVGIGAGLGVARRCVRENEPVEIVSAVGCGIGGAIVLEGVTFGVLPVALTLGSYFTHRKLDGGGRWYAALAGSAVGMAAGVGVAGLALAVRDTDRSFAVGSVAGVIVAASVPVLALELSHLRQRARERRVSSIRRTQVMPVASALAGGGGWLGIAGTL